MALNFPTSPVNNQVYDNYIYNSVLGVWKVNWSLPTQLGTVTVGTWNANPIAIAYGGTGATDVATARTNLGLAGLSGIQTFTGLQTFTPSTNSTSALIVKGLSGQTANIQEWQDNLGNVTIKVSSGGDLIAYNRVAVGSTSVFASTWLSVQSRFSGEIGLAVRGQTGQTANLQEWQNSGGTILSRVDASGNVFASTFTGNLSGYVGSTNNGRTGNIPFISITSQAQWSSLPVGIGSMVNLTSTGIPSANYQYFHKIANRDVSGGWGGISIDTALGDFYIGNTPDNASYASWKKVAFQSQSQTFSGQQTLSLITPAGTTTIPSIALTAGTNLTSPADGAIEYDGSSIYATTSASHGRGVVPTVLYSTGTNTFTSTTAAQNIFPAANDTLNVLANTTYLLDMYVYFTVPATSSVAHTAGIAFGGTATLTTAELSFTVSESSTSGNIGGAPRFYRGTGLTLFSGIWTTSTAGTAIYRLARVQGIIRFSTSGTFIPQIQTSVATVAIPAGTVGNYITMTPIGLNSTAAVGAWS